ncbi:MAG: hypothetical protein Q9166_004364 [cf. Caloplaca sp. 2 TL-2023]
MRVLKIEVKVPLNSLRSRARFFFTCNEPLGIDSLHLERLPDIISAWTEEFSHLDDLNTDLMARRFHVPGGQVLEITEENGNSMTRHICSSTIEQKSDGAPFNILELGTGCGTVGLALGIRSDCHFILTDEDDEALKFAKHNARQSRETFNPVWECRTLNWSEPHRFKLDRPLDFIVASDCIYNSDSIPNLVKTMSDLVRQSNALETGSSPPKIIVGTKVRHSSEAAFFDLMQASGFEQKEHANIPVQDRYRKSVGQELEAVDIYVFEDDTEAVVEPRKD